MSKNIHIKKFADGKETPKEMHARIAWNGARCLCGNAAAVRVRMFGEVQHLVKEKPEFIMALAAQNNGNIPMAEFKHGKFIRVSEVFVCSGCRAGVERDVARSPSWLFPEFDEGPKDIPIAVQNAGLVTP